MATGGGRAKRKLKEKIVKQIVELAKGKYKDFNDPHLSEKLEEQEQIKLSREKLRQLLRAHGIASPRKRRGVKHRSRRERRAGEGMMLQVDGSPHDGLEGRGPPRCLIGAIDDATGKVMGAFFAQPTVRGGTSNCSPRSSENMDCPRRSMPTVTLGVLDRPRVDVSGAVDQQKAHHRSGPRLGTTRSDLDPSSFAPGQGQNRKTVQHFPRPAGP